MYTKLNPFLNDDSGAVTVDWVLLTAAVLGLALLAVRPIGLSTMTAADEVSTYVSTVDFSYANN